MLTIKEIDAVKHDPTRYQRLSDGENLYLLVHKSGSRFWRWDYTFKGTRKTLSLGVYPRVTLQRAREKKRDAQVLLDRGIDPSAKRQEDKGHVNQTSPTMREVGALWIARKQEEGKKPATLEKYTSVLENYVYETLGDRPIQSLTTPDLVAVAEVPDLRDLREAAHKVVEFLQGIFKFAVNKGIVTTDITGTLYDAIRPKEVEHYPGLTETAEIGKLLRAIMTNTVGQFTVRKALQFMPYVFLRPGEVRGLEKTEVKLSRNVLEIPAGRMSHRFSNGEFHVVPLSRQARAILEETLAEGGDGKYVFQGRERGRPISDGTLNQMLLTLGYSRAKHCPHGFRTTAATLLREEPLNWDSDTVELQLSHKVKNPVRAAYDKSALIPRRTEMMQQYADYLDSLWK